MIWVYINAKVANIVTLIVGVFIVTTDGGACRWEWGSISRTEMLDLRGPSWYLLGPLATFLGHSWLAGKPKTFGALASSHSM